MRTTLFVSLVFVAATLNAQNVTNIEIPGATSIQLNLVSPNGVIEGSFSSASGMHSFLRFRDGRITVFDLAVTIPEGPTFGVSPIAINDKGQIVGEAIPFMQSNQRVASYTFLRDVDGTITVFSFPNAFYTVPVGIDTKGDVVGSWEAGENRPFHGWVRMADGTLTGLISNTAVVIPDVVTPGGEVIGRYFKNNLGPLVPFVLNLREDGEGDN